MFTKMTNKDYHIAYTARYTRVLHLRHTADGRKHRDNIVIAC